MDPEDVKMDPEDVKMDPEDVNFLLNMRIVLVASS